ncbi:MAG: hypothetical protein JO313_04500 [Verrucomicrobia bacterium]|nr:hypothetical protein [Verrucomicrobiota bacterium]MBV9130225.1 hypothetical protein [Verrucomicrobiota bacterium]MBV9642465.1 hypothetical protein [Verrucomicrobiota bacterium]
MCSSCDTHGPDFTVYLDYGIDCCFGNHGDLSISERGIVLRSRWHFPLGTQLAIRICAHPVTPEDCPVCEDLTGMVVSCERMEDRYSCFEATILFLDVTLPAQQGLGRVADRLDLASQVS